MPGANPAKVRGLKVNYTMQGPLRDERSSHT